VLWRDSLSSLGSIEAEPKESTMDPTLEHFLIHPGAICSPLACTMGTIVDCMKSKEVTPMRTMDERTKHGMASRMKDVVVNPPQRVVRARAAGARHDS
jgi:hypothetical protein